MYKLLFWVFILNFILKLLLINIPFISYDILFILSRFLLTLYIIFIWFKFKKNTFNYSILYNKKWIILSILVTLICFLIITKNVENKNLDKYYLLLVECISVGILEELLFRYIAFDYFFSKSKKYEHSATLVSLLFALFHISNLLSGSSIFSVINQIEVAFLFGLLLQFVFFKTKNLIIVSTIHALINFIGSNTSLENKTLIEHITFHDFIFNQILILFIYIIFIPVYKWGLKNHLN